MMVNISIISWPCGGAGRAWLEKLSDCWEILVQADWARALAQPAPGGARETFISHLPPLYIIITFYHPTILTPSPLL